MVFVSSADLPEPPWSSLRGKRAPRKQLTRESIADAAMHIVDSEGMDALSMRRLAQELGVQASALYTHVSGKGELLQLLIDRVAGELSVPDPDPARWQEQLKEVVRAMYHELLRHRDLAGASLANIPTGPNVLAFTDRLLALLLAGRLPKQVAGYAADLIPQFVTVSAYERSLFEERLERQPEYFDAVHQYWSALPAERFPVLTSMIGEIMNPDEGPDDRFEFGLDVLVRGLAAFAAD
jgi:AcrR family transcriptional regulator